MAALVRTLNNDFAAANGFFARLADVVATYKARAAYRNELASLSFREIQDIGLDQTEIDREIAKPFWRA
jgi:uncharacterized protein YjiS (DUF1127 family)